MPLQPVLNGVTKTKAMIAQAQDVRSAKRIAGQTPGTEQVVLVLLDPVVPRVAAAEVVLAVAREVAVNMHANGLAVAITVQFCRPQ